VPDLAERGLDLDSEAIPAISHSRSNLPPCLAWLAACAAACAAACVAARCGPLRPVLVWPASRARKDTGRTPQVKGYVMQLTLVLYGIGLRGCQPARNVCVVRPAGPLGATRRRIRPGQGIRQATGSVIRKASRSGPREGFPVPWHTGGVTTVTLTSGRRRHRDKVRRCAGSEASKILSLRNPLRRKALRVRCDWLPQR
jgi:hypothetical protein